MRITLPLTGKVKEYIGDVVIGDNDDPIRPVDVDLGNVSWRMVDLDVDSETMTIEVQAAEKLSVQTGMIGDEPVYETRPMTEEEKQFSLDWAKAIEAKGDELYDITKCHKLIKDVKHG
ncbi:MAG: hypothetical protein KKC55_13820 [Gammaproteobacteria bacterium]|nr:hypothetical protein [Gammaproteobacteria bacterium]